MRLPSGELITLPITSKFASEAFVAGGNVDWGSERLLYSLLTGKGAFLDIGANIGYYSIYMLPKVSAAFCFEPDPRVRVLLEKSIAHRTKAHILPFAVGASEGKASFTLERASEVSHLSEMNEMDKNQIEVDVVTVDSFVASRSLSIEAIKIDAEGHDIEVIAGSLTVLANQSPVVLTEAKPDGDLFGLMAKVSYSVFSYVRHPQTRKNSFMQLFPNTPVPGDTKMLFLVPSRLVDQIKRMTA